MSCCYLSEMSPRLILTICAISFGSCFQYGLHFGIWHTNSPLYRLFKSEVEYKEWPDLTKEDIETLNSWFVPLFIYGALAGAALIGIFADKLGRKGALLYNNLFVLFAVILIGFAKPNGSYKMLLAGRFFSGLNIGLNSGLVPIYLIEISSVRLRGLIGSMYPLTIAIANLIGQILIQDNIALRFHKTTLWLFVFMILPAVFQLIISPMCPESPKFLLLQNVNREAEALKGLQWLRGQDSSLINTEVMEMTLETETNSKFSYANLFLNSSLRMPLIIGCLLVGVQNICGTHVLILYSLDIFRWVGINKESGFIALGIVVLLMTIMSMILVQKNGRKKLIFCGLTGMSVTCLFLFPGIRTNRISSELPSEDWNSMIPYLNLFAYFLFFGLFSLSMGTIPMYFAAEISNQKSRAMTVSFAAITGWAMFWILSSSGVLLSVILEGVGSFIFIIYAMILTLSAIFVWFKVPETKDLSTEDISQGFRQAAGLPEEVEATLV